MRPSVGTDSGSSEKTGHQKISPIVIMNRCSTLRSHGFRSATSYTPPRWTTYQPTSHTGKATVGLCKSGAFPWYLITDSSKTFIDITRRNINSGFDFAQSLVGAKTLAEAMELHSTYWTKQLNTLRAQAEEMRDLSTRVTSDVVEPAKAQVKRGMAEIERTH